MQQIQDLRVAGFSRLQPPCKIKAELPMTSRCRETVVRGRRGVLDVLNQNDDRLLVVLGPCSIHDPKGALEYAGKLARLNEELGDRLLLVMRTYFEKPRTTIGWKGLINDPRMDGSCEIEEGLSIARKLLIEINEMGLPCATEFLDPIVPQYIADLISWAAIGARTTESQTHREMASGLSMPVGFKNGTDGGLQIAIDAMSAARSAHSFVGIDQEGYTCIVRTKGNPDGHVVLRGGRSRSNYDPESIREACAHLTKHQLPNVLMVDCSHANSGKQSARQAEVWRSITEQRLSGTRAIIGAMLESYLREGSQPMASDPADLEYGISVTDACIDWACTESLLRSAHELLGERQARRSAPAGTQLATGH
jgi:3-deoxy-7-phosphoheptulonate synthase